MVTAIFTSDTGRAGPVNLSRASIEQQATSRYSQVWRLDTVIRQTGTLWDSTHYATQDAARGDIWETDNITFNLCKVYVRALTGQRVRQGARHYRRAISGITHSELGTFGYCSFAGATRRVKFDYFDTWTLIDGTGRAGANVGGATNGQ